MNKESSTTDYGVLIRRTLFVLMLITMSLINLFVLFRGLSSPQAMDQAQIAREIARGHGFSTQMIRPIAYYQAGNKDNKAVAFEGFKDTYHSPLNPLVYAAVFKMIGADQEDKWQMQPNKVVFALDRVVASVSTIFFLLAIGVNYLLITRMFDAKIAGVTALLMLFCAIYWQFAVSGLPQMLMLFLFSCGMFFVYRSAEDSAEERSSLTMALLAGLFFTLLALTHWVTVWIALGYLIYSAIAFRPRGVVAGSVFLLLLASGAYTVFRNYMVTGTPFGTAFFTLYNGLGNGAEISIMRKMDFGSQPLVLDGLISKILRTTLMQFGEIVPLMGGIIVAPLFFVSLLHSFRSRSINSFRWAILMMWSTGAIGLAFFGISDKPLDPNQTHLLFAPLMTAYGLAFLSILWGRLDFVAKIPSLKNAHHVIVILVCALPVLLDLPRNLRSGMTAKDQGGFPQWPPYYPPVLNHHSQGLKGWVEKNEIVFSDQPWAVAWYADRMSIWLPPDKESFLKLESIATSFDTPIAGILISPASHSAENLTQAMTVYADFSSLMLDGKVIQATYPPGVGIYENTTKISEIANHYPHRNPLAGMDMIYYSSREFK